MSRRAFIEGHGATCKNWRWSWSFVNHADRFVIFGAWDVATEGEVRVILKDEWKINPNTGKKNGAFSEAVEYIALVNDKGYQLKTFKMSHDLADPYQPKGSAKITSFDDVLDDGKLVRIDGAWAALLGEGLFNLPDEFSQNDGGQIPLAEGNRSIAIVNRIERSAKARFECIKANGLDCFVCSFNFAKNFGEIGAGFIHIHHKFPLGDTEGKHLVDPINDLVPVCPNCHAMLHKRNPPYEVDELKEILGNHA